MHTVVIGGGVVGLSCALALAERGGDVTVCEAGTLGGGSTGRAAGGIRAQFSTPVNVDLSLASVPVWESFEERFGVDVDYRKNGYLFLAREEETAAAFEANVEMQTARGVDSRTLSPAEAREHCPQLRAEAFVAATYCPDDGVADPHSAVQGYSRAVEERGVDVRTRTPVTGLSPPESADGPWRVETPGETLSADYVVNAAGAWARRVGRLAGVELPIAPRRRQATVVEPETAMAESVPLTVDLDRGVYFRPEREGTALVGGHFADADPDVDPDDFSESPDLAWTAEAVERAADAAAYFGPETRVRNGWAGLYAVTPDHHAVVDEARPGFVVAAGFSGHGFQHAPATGECVAELCLDGAASHVDVSALSLERFESDEPGTVEQNVA
ncbi:glycine/d-amino acid oxidase, deaminating [Halogeometricum pallidum JCM 14848]|uniref:Glycine/d-amino acid oxidase, deaminating n=1 Tax=Halogeometricum pallidum JCM 14848 TaxID=1227487 RepID=M0D8R4_HALPD|nr:FAD-dependent oxidoreductase [Halogeometricum pallidum]ELZ31077.1 glycine/d-amino acid oxidase, deaminating [Halogeometricum pallidum JCM 14848]